MSSTLVPATRNFTKNPSALRNTLKAFLRTSELDGVDILHVADAVRALPPDAPVGIKIVLSNLSDMIAWAGCLTAIGIPEAVCNHTVESQLINRLLETARLSMTTSQHGNDEEATRQIHLGLFVFGIWQFLAGILECFPSVPLFTMFHVNLQNASSAYRRCKPGSHSCSMKMRRQCMDYRCFDAEASRMFTF